MKKPGSVLKPPGSVCERCGESISRVHMEDGSTMIVDATPLLGVVSVNKAVIAQMTPVSDDPFSLVGQPFPHQSAIYERHSCVS